MAYYSAEQRYYCTATDVEQPATTVDTTANDAAALVHYASSGSEDEVNGPAADRTRPRCMTSPRDIEPVSLIGLDNKNSHCRDCDEVSGEQAMKKISRKTKTKKTSSATKLA